MCTRVSYPYEMKIKSIEMRLAGIPMRQVLNELNIRHRTQVETWMSWYKNRETNRFEQPVGKQYTFHKGRLWMENLIMSWSDVSVISVVNIIFGMFIEKLRYSYAKKYT